MIHLQQLFAAVIPQRKTFDLVFEIGRGRRSALGARHAVGAARCRHVRVTWHVEQPRRDRDRVGRETYGTPLQAFNGRDALLDAYHECLDMAVYLKQAIIERDSAK